MATLRVVLDTNVLVSGLAYPGSVPGRIVNAWRQGQLDVALSHHILDELTRVLPRLPRLGLTPHEVRDLADSLMFLADVVDTEGVAPHPTLRDGADQPVLATLVAAQARYLITGDKDLLDLAGEHPVLSPAQFWALHGG
jgi:putative PIN family toxin of toxin-antitoxin system